jgi:uncharacterized RDD family membrane protein YckC
MAMQPPPPPAAPLYAPPHAAPAPTGARYAGFWIRLVAYIIDYVITGAVTLGLIKATGVITVLCPPGVTNVSDPSCGAAQFSGLFFVLILIPVVYDIVLWAVGGTLGQRALGMRVVNADTGGNLGLGRSLLRFVGLLISTIPIYLGLIWVGFDARKQGWHDKIAGSLVVRIGG